MKEDLTLHPALPVDDHGFAFLKVLEGGRLVTVVNLTFGRARICIGPDMYLLTDAW